jgi:hypothetical protein
MQRLDVRNPGEVGSVSNVEADLPDGRKLLVLSGIAITDWEVDTDEIQRGETHVYLGIYGSRMDQSSAFVGLSSIANDETGFVFAVDSARVQLDPESSELVLVFNPALMGEPSSLNRVSYQVVVTLEQITAHIRGMITWFKQHFEPPNTDVSTIDPELEILANRYDSTPPPGGVAGSLTPVTRGHIVSARKMRDFYIAQYEIVGPPMAVPLKVTVTPSAKFVAPPSAAITVGRVNGPDVFTLKASAPDLNDLNFVIGAVGVS